MDYISFRTEKPFDHIPNYDTHTILDHIKMNEIVLLELAHPSDYYFDDVKDMVEALAENTSIVNVEMQDDFFGCLRKSDREALMDAISFLPNLQHVTLADSCVLMGSVTSLLKHAKKLNTLHLTRIVMQGLQRDFNVFENWLYLHPTLKSFEMKECTAANTTVDTEPLVSASHSMAPTAPLPGACSKVLKRNNSAIAA